MVQDSCVILNPYQFFMLTKKIIHKNLSYVDLEIASLVEVQIDNLMIIDK